MSAADVVLLEAARTELVDVAARRAALLIERANAARALAVLERTGASAAALQAATRAVERLRRDDERLAADESRLAARIEELRERIRRDAPERSVEQLEGSVPTTLLPVRLETRFADQNRALRIRVFPEQIHVDTHEAELTAEEVAVAQLYWQQRWAAGADIEARRAAWAQLARVVRPARARWLVEATTPTNVGSIGQGQPDFPATPQKAAPWTRAPVARLLPEQWVALGYRSGVEVFRAWGLPVAETVAVGLAPDLDAPDSAGPPPAEQTALPIDDGMRWMVDYDAALAAGMAITVTDASLTSGRLADGLDELVVLGVDWGLRPEAAAASLAAQLTRHSVSDGLAVLGPGTPTNNTDEARAAAGTDPLLDPAALDPAETDAGVQAEGERIGRALGLPENTAFTSVPGRGRFDDGPRSDMANALWAPTIGYFLDQMMRPLVSTRTSDAVAAHARRWVRARGPFGCLRVGRQPYGVLPVLAGRLESDDAFQLGLARQLEGLRPFWTNAVNAVPRLGDSDRPDADLIELLRRTPRSGTFRFREAAGATYTTSIFGFDFAAIFQEQLAGMLLGLAGISGQAEISHLTVRPAHRGVPVPLVARGELSETDPPEPNFVAAVHANTVSTGGFRRLLENPGSASSLLEALLQQASSLEYAIGSTLLVLHHELATQVLTVEPRVATLFEREVHGVELTVNDDAEPSLLMRVEGPVELASTRVTAISGGRSLVDFLAVTPDAELGVRVETQRFAAFRASLERLAKVSSAELERLAADVLDCASHRLDAWITSLATRRLDDLRDDAVPGCHVGGFGYVEDLVPRSTPTSLGYLQAPSIAHAITAAVLRSGHLARREDAEGALAIDLASTRVSLALELIEGVRRGHSIGALLGYRFERGLRDRRMTLAQYILPMRQLAPLASTAAGPDDGTPVEVIAARDVVDGVLLLRRWKADPDGTFGALSVTVPPDDRADIELELRHLDDALDAVSDLLVAESVHQAVLGNAERSAAALDALDRQSAVPDVGFVRTPRSGQGASHRLLLLLQAVAPAPGWDGPTDPRQLAEPRVDAWAGTVLGNPDRYRFAADVLDSDGAVVQIVSARLPELGLSALGTICACAATGPGGTSELEERLALRLSAAVTAPRAERLVFRDDPPSGSPASARGLRELLELGDQMLDLLAGARQADTRALAPDTERPEAGVDAGELRTRADGAVAALRAAADALDALPEAASSDAIAAALLALASAGQRTAVPAGDDASALAAQASAALSMSATLLAGLDAADASFDRAGSDATAQVAHDLARLRRVFGESFPALATFTATNGAELSTSAGDSGLLGADPLAPARWLTQHALVRPAAARLADVLTAVEMLGGDVGLEALTVAQLPHRPGERWISLPRASAADRPTAAVSIVAHSATSIDFTGPMAGLVVDQWSDVVPNDHETTGLSFHYDAPGARAPQTILVAVPGDRAAPFWTVEALAGTVREAMALARIRALDIDDLEGVGRFLPAIYLPFNVETKTPSVNLAGIIGLSIQQNNLAFLAEDG